LGEIGGRVKPGKTRSYYLLTDMPPAATSVVADCATLAKAPVPEVIENTVMVFVLSLTT
jgi:hypothetical protein